MLAEATGAAGVRARLNATDSIYVTIATKVTARVGKRRHAAPIDTGLAFDAVRVVATVVDTSPRATLRANPTVRICHAAIRNGVTPASQRIAHTASRHADGLATEVGNAHTCWATDLAITLAARTSLIAIRVNRATRFPVGNTAEGAIRTGTALMSTGRATIGPANFATPGPTTNGLPLGVGVTNALAAPLIGAAILPVWTATSRLAIDPRRWTTKLFVVTGSIAAGVVTTLRLAIGATIGTTVGRSTGTNAGRSVPGLRAGASDWSRAGRRAARGLRVGFAHDNARCGGSPEPEQTLQESATATAPAKHARQLIELVPVHMRPLDRRGNPRTGSVDDQLVHSRTEPTTKRHNITRFHASY